MEQANTRLLIRHELECLIWRVLNNERRDYGNELEEIYKTFIDEFEERILKIASQK